MKAPAWRSLIVRPVARIVVRTFLTVLLAPLLLLSCRVATLSGTPADLPPGELEEPSQIDTLVYVYMDGSEPWRTAALQTLNQLEAAALHGRTVVLALAALGEGDPAGGPTGTHLFRIEPDELPNSVTSPGINAPLLGIGAGLPSSIALGSSEALRAFLETGERLYAADRTALVLWGAGMAPEVLPNSDGGPEDPLTPTEARIAVADRTPEVLVMDAPSGGMLESAYELRRTGAVLLATQSYLGPGLWSYTALAEILSAEHSSRNQMASELVSAAAAAMALTAGATAAAIDVGKIPAVVGALDEQAEPVAAAITSAAQRELLRDALFYEVTDFYRTPGNLNLDLAGVADEIESAYPEYGAHAESLRNAVDDAVLAAWEHPGRSESASGLSVHYIPLDSYGYPVAHHESYTGLAGGTPLEFVSASAWPPDTAIGTGLLYRLWYQPF